MYLKYAVLLTVGNVRLRTCPFVFLCTCWCNVARAFVRKCLYVDGLVRLCRDGSVYELKHSLEPCVGAMVCTCCSRCVGALMH